MSNFLPGSGPSEPLNPAAATAFQGDAANAVLTKLGTTVCSARAERFSLSEFETTVFFEVVYEWGLHVKVMYIMAYFIGNLSPINISNQDVLVDCCPYCPQKRRSLAC